MPQKLLNLPVLENGQYIEIFLLRLFRIAGAGVENIFPVSVDLFFPDRDIASFARLSFAA